MLFKTDTLFGHVIEDTDDGPVYQDDGSKVDGDNPRPCLGCKVKIQHGEQDPCIANLPGTLNACCGHGRERTPVSAGLAGYVALRDGRTFRFPGTVGGEAIRAAVDLAIAEKELPEGFVFDEEKMWWYGLTDAQVAYVHANTRRAIFVVVREVTAGKLPDDSYLTSENPWWTGLDDDQKGACWAALGGMMSALAAEAREKA